MIAVHPSMPVSGLAFRQRGQLSSRLCASAAPAHATASTGTQSHPLPLIAGVPSTLPLRAIKGRAVALDDTADAVPAIAPRTGLALPAIDRPLVLEIPQLARGLDIVADGGAAGGDGALEHLADRQHQATGALEGDGARQAPRRKAGVVEHL